MRAISLYSGAGGMDVGFARAGFRITQACELARDAAETLAANSPDTTVHQGDVAEFSRILHPGPTDILFGGPPCQGYSVAGKMDPTDPRSAQVWVFIEAVRCLRPETFVMENVNSLATFSKWRGTFSDILEASKQAGYATHAAVLNAHDFGVPQTRRRVFLFGSRSLPSETLSDVVGAALERRQSKGGAVGDVCRHLGRAGTVGNPRTCDARITFAQNPVMRASPYSGMLFNGGGRPLRPGFPAPTIAASAGGNRTHIVDEAELFEGSVPFVVGYHRSLARGDAPCRDAPPASLRRLTVAESMALQTFPEGYTFKGTKSSVYRQIGNAVPCALAEAVGEAAMAICLAGRIRSRVA